MAAASTGPELVPRLYAHIVGWGMAVPECVMTNDDLSAFVDTNDQWIHERTGIRQRYIANDRESSATLGLGAARRALEIANILPTDLDLIVVATSTPEHIFPATASLIQDWLGATKAGAYDLSAACSGFVYALENATQAIKAGSVKIALVIGAETMSRVMDWHDRTTCVLFGDGAGAVVLKASTQPGGVLASLLRSDGAGCDLLAIPTQNVRDLAGHRLNRMYMAGQDVFKFAVRVVDEGIRQCLDKAGVALEDVRLIVPHQANQRILASVAKRLKMDSSMFMSNVERYGNTSAASIPIALCEAIEQKRVRANDHIVLIGFGGGLTWAASVIKWGVPKPEAPLLNRPRRQFAYALADVRSRFTRLQRAYSALRRRLKKLLS